VGLFDGLTNASFKSDAEGNTIFFPYGKLGKGRAISDKNTEEKVRRFITRYLWANFFFVIIVGRAVGFIWILLALPIIIFWYRREIERHLRDVPTSDTKMSVEESMQNIATGTPRLLLRFILLASIVSLLVSVALLTETGQPGLMLAVLFFALCSALPIYMLRSKNKDERGHSSLHTPESETSQNNEVP
jgi:hypothetical protein